MSVGSTTNDLILEKNIRESTIETFGEKFVDELSLLICGGKVESLGQLYTVSSSLTISIPSIDLIKEYFLKWSDKEICDFIWMEVKSPEFMIYQIDCKEFITNLRFIVNATQFHMVFSECPNMLALACPILWPMIIGDYIKARKLYKRLIRDKFITIHVIFSKKQ